MIKILHTSDWHLGRTLYGKKRYEEFEAFLLWIQETVQQNEIDVLLIAGDIFDNGTPSNKAQELYYQFLSGMAKSTCRHVVITAGNHDSPSFLNAPKEILKFLDVHIVSHIDDWEEEVLVLRGKQGQPELIVCAVPYLRDRDIRTVEAGESIQDKDRKLMEGIRNHYAQIGAIAEKKRNELGMNIPIIGMGHLFTAGGQTLKDDGVRDLYIGSLAHVTAEIFPTCFDYLALGHLHVPQKVAKKETMRYSGSPLPMGFGEARQQKSVSLVEFQGTKATVRLINVPVFQHLEQIRGNFADISNRIDALKKTDASYWIEVTYDGDEIIGDLKERMEEQTEGTKIEILRIKNNRVEIKVLEQVNEENLEELNEEEVFKKCLLFNQVPENQYAELLETYRETMKSLYEDDLRAE